MKVSLYTSWDINCGIADHSAQFKSALEKNRVVVSVVPTSQKKGMFDLIRSGKTMNNADVAHIQHEFSFFANAFVARSFINCVLFLRQIRIPKVLTMHEVVPPGEGLPRFPFLHLYRMMFGAVDIITVHTEKHRNVILAMDVPAAKVILVPLPVQEVKLPGETKQHYKSMFGAGGKQVVTVFGYPNRRKGYELVLDAIQDIDDCVFLIAGGAHSRDRSGYVEQLQNQIRERNLGSKVKLTGYLPDSQIPAAMGATDIILAPFLDMPGSASLNMGIAYHKPIIGSDIEQMKELQTRGIGVDIFRLDTPGDLRKKIVSLLGDARRQAELERLSASYAAQYSYEKTAARFRDLYVGLLKTKGI